MQVSTKGKALKTYDVTPHVSVSSINQSTLVSTAAGGGNPEAAEGPGGGEAGAAEQEGGVPEGPGETERCPEEAGEGQGGYAAAPQQDGGPASS